MKRAASPRNEQPVHRLPAPPDAIRPPQATTPQASAATAPVLRVASAPAPDLVDSLPQEVRGLITHLLDSRADRMALAHTSHSQYATQSPRRQLDFFVTHCHQIAALPEQQIAGFTASGLSQPLLNAVPGTAVLVALFKLHCLLEKNPQAVTHLQQQLNQMSGDELRTAFRLFERWAQAYAPAAGDRMLFLNADFLASAPLLARVTQLTGEEGRPDAQVALAETLLSWTACHGSQHLLMAFGKECPLPIPPTWHALEMLASELSKHYVNNRSHPEGHGIPPELLLRMISLGHLVQESGILLRSTRRAEVSRPLETAGLTECVHAFLSELSRAPAADAEQTLLRLAGQVLAWQIAAHQTQPPHLPHMASLRVFSVLLEAGDAAFVAGSPQDLALLHTAIEATHNEFARFAHTMHTAPVAGFPVWREAQPEPAALPEPSSDDDRSEQEDSAIIGWDWVGKLIALHSVRDQEDIGNSHNELLLKLSPVFDNLGRGMTRYLSNEQTCRVRLIDSMLATLRELSLRLETVPEPARAPLAEDLRAIIRLWPMESHQDLLEDWLPDTQ